MPLTGPQARAARALAELSREIVAGRASMEVEALRAFEVGKVHPGADAVGRLQAALEAGGAVFIDEDDLGVGVRLKFPRGDVRSIRRLENEGGVVGEDDV